MSLIKPRTLPGVMELLPHEQLAFQRMLKIIGDTYERYGFLPIETPVFELVDVLLTKSGGETEKQVFFVEKTGDIYNRINAQKRLNERQAGATGFTKQDMQDAFEALKRKSDPEKYLNKLPDEALRFDLTVPLARYVAEHEHDLTFPFRRYQMQRVYRGERPQRGRLNEFYQCDIDVIGKDSLSPRYDAEIPVIICDIFEQLAFGDFTINFSNRKIVMGLMSAWGYSDAIALRELDKLDKQGIDKTRSALINVISEDNADELLRLATLRGSNSEILRELEKSISKVDHGAHPELAEGYRELNIMCEALAALGVPEQRTRLNLGIVRGLDYYTGTVYETTVDAYPEFGSICSGGRYENLAGHYTKSKLPGVGISIGASRLFDQLRATDWIKGRDETTTEVLITQLDESLFTDYLQLAATLRRAGIATEIMLEGGKIQKQMKYADRAGIRHVVLMGPDEKAKGTVTLKNLTSGEQQEIAIDQLASHLRP